MVLSLVSHFIDEYQKERIEFQRILLGIKSERHRWSQCVDWTNKKLGMAVGALFIRDNFNSESKESALEMIHSIREAFNELLDENDWMDDETRAVAKEKANSMNERIGYPDILTNVNCNNFPFAKKRKIMWINIHCPFVRFIFQVTELEKEYSNVSNSRAHLFFFFVHKNMGQVLIFDANFCCSWRFPKRHFSTTFWTFWNGIHCDNVKCCENQWKNKNGQPNQP